MIGCAVHIHTVGKGPQDFTKQESRQWYILFGLVPLNKVDTNQLAGGAANYEIRTEQSAVDVLMNFFTAYVSIVSRTVTVTN